MSEREAMQQALDALNLPSLKTQQMLRQRDEAITSLRAQLELPDRQALQAAGTHPAPCARHCEAKAFEIEIRGLKSALRAALEQQAEPVAWMYSDDHERMLETETFCTVYSVKVGSPDKGVTDVPLYTQPPQRKPLTDDMVHRAMIALNTASCGEFQPTFDEMKSALEAAHGIGEKP